MNDGKKEIKNNLEGIVVELEATNRIQLPKHDNLEGEFLVTDNLFIAKNYYGPIGVYSLNTGEKIVDLPFDMCDVGRDYSFATDGRFLYVKVQKDFEIKDEDIILARLPKKSNQFSITEFSGSSVGELRNTENIPKQSKEAGINKRVVSIPLDSISHPAYIWDTESFLSTRKCFLITEEMGSNQFLHSEKGYVVLHYKSDPSYEGLCDSSLFIKEGELCMPKDKEIKNMRESSFQDGKIPTSIKIEKSNTHPSGILASNNVFYENYPQADYEENYKRFPMNIIFKNTTGPPRNFINLVHSDDKLYILTRIEDNKENGISYITSPNVLITYQIRLHKLSPISDS